MASSKPDNLNEGLPEHRGLDATGRAAAEARLAPRAPTIGGSLADLQRMVADQFEDDPSSVVVNPAHDGDVLLTPAENDAGLGVATLETDRKGLTADIEAAREAAAADVQTADDNKGTEASNVVDPGSESPKAKK